MSSPPPFVPILSSDDVLNRVQQALVKTLSQLVSNPLAGGSSVSVDFTSLAANVDLQVPHNLGTTKVAWLVGTQSTGGSIYLSPNNSNTTINPSPQNNVVLRATVPMRAVLYFFQGTSVPTASPAPTATTSTTS